MQLMLGDCLERMKEIPDGSVDLVLTDPPYGTTACKWDSVIPFEQMWEQVWRVLRPNGAAVLFGSEPFISALRMSQINKFKYDWYWNKPSVTGFANAKMQPLRCVEVASIFCRGRTTYNPQGLRVLGAVKRNGSSVGGDSLRGDVKKTSGKGRLRTAGSDYVQEFTNYPRQTLNFSRETGYHPTQKPVSLMEYLIRTYTNEGETVLDFTMGSGTTGVACVNTGRDFIGIERDEGYFQIAEKRIAEASK